MKKFFIFVIFGSLVVSFVGCQSNSYLSTLQTGGTQTQVSNSPEDQFIRTGMVRTLYTNGGTNTQYLMNGSQGLPVNTQQQTDEYRQQLLNGPVADCFKQNGLQEDLCLEKFVKARTEKDGPEAAFADLKILYDESDVVRSYCHPLAHAIGHAAVDKYPNVDDAYKHGSDFCWSGYYHGVMEEIMDRIGKENLPAKLNSICSAIPGKASYSFDYYNCVHGMGHGLMDVAGDHLKDALKLCDNLTGSWEDQSCYSGVFMQNVINDGLPYHTADLKPTDTVYPCNVVEQKYKETCYLMQTSYMLKINHYDFAKTFDLCAHVDKGFSVTCYRSEGRDASGLTSSDLEKTRANCLFGKDYTQQSECFVGAVKDFISYYHDDVKAKKLCQSLDDPTEGTQALNGQAMTQYCLQTAADYYKIF